MMKENETKFEELANKCLKLVKNKLYFSYKSLSPAIYRMPIEYVQPGSGMFGTDANRIYADPMNVIMRYKQSPDAFVRTYLHMLFHCIYLHPFVTKYGVDIGVWNIALDICAEAAVLRMEPKELDGDSQREQIISNIKQNIKMFIPELVYNELTKNGDRYDFEKLVVLFHMDDHIWLESNNGKSGNSDNDDDDDNDYQNPNPNQQPQNNDQNNDEQDKNQNGDEDNKDKNEDDSDDNDQNNDGKGTKGSGGNNNDNSNDNDNNNGNNNGNNKKNNDNNQNNGNGNNNNQKKNNKTKSQNQSSQKKQEWSDVSRQIATDMQSFHQQGKNSGDTVQEIEFLTQDKMEYDEFLRQFSIIEEKMMVNQDEFDYMYYTYGLTGMKRPDGSCATDKSVLLIEPLEYKEEKVIKDFVIAIDTSGSCSGDLTGMKRPDGSCATDKSVLLIEPLEYKEEKVIKDFVIAIDTSGSCSGDLVKKFLNKTYSILKETESFSSRVNIHIVQCDAKVQHDTKITNMDEMEYFMQHMKLYGFGGTDFRPVFTYVDELIAKKEFENLCGLIYFTDGYGTYPTKPTPYKTAFAFLDRPVFTYVDELIAKKEFENLCGLIYFTDGYGTYPTKPTPYKTAFAFLEDYNHRENIPSWAMSVYWKEDN